MGNCEDDINNLIIQSFKFVNETYLCLKKGCSMNGVVMRKKLKI